MGVDPTAVATVIGIDPQFKDLRGDAVRLDHRLERVDDLLADALLDGEALGEDAREARQLGDADDAFMRDVPDVGVAVEWQRMVFAERKEVNRTLDDLA